jgi:hypothetical protein
VVAELGRNNPIIDFGPYHYYGHDGYKQTCYGQQGAKGAIRFDKHEIFNIGSESISSNCPCRDRDSASNDSPAIEFAVKDDTRFPPANARTSEIASERELFGFD